MSTPRESATSAADLMGALDAALAGRYVLERELGRGGMATVYLARDIRHGRPVALKVLHPELGAVLGAERFLREIAVTASLHHPHILALHDSGEAGGRLYYVMPRVEGESLRERLARERQLPVEEAVRIAAQVASALDYAHRHGVLHRDIKPENVLLDADGHALVADFGIARAVQRATDPDTLTSTGVTLGTPQYMSPEQAAGERDLDARSDVYALGSVLYELLAGSPPFTAPTAQGVVARVLTEEPRPVAQLRRAVPPQVEAAVQKALQKLPADRFATARELAEALQRRVAASTGAVTPGALPLPVLGARAAVRRHWVLHTLLGIIAASALGAAAVMWARLRAMPAPRSVRFALPLESVPLPLVATRVAVSRDGRAIAYVGGTAPRWQLYVRRLDQLRAYPLAGADGTTGFFFSPDSKWIGFIGDDLKLKKVPLEGGPPVTLAGAGTWNFAGASWGPGDVIVFGQRSDWRGLSRLPGSGGTLQHLTTPNTARGEDAHVSPVVLADGETVLFMTVSSASRSRSDGHIAVGSLTTGRYTVLDVRGSQPLGVAEGHLLYLDPLGVVMAAPFDAKRRKVTGAPVRVAEEVTPAVTSGALPVLADDGTLVYFYWWPVNTRVMLVEMSGAARPLDAGPRDFRFPRFAPDGRRIAVTVGIAPPEVWLYDVASRTLSPLTSQGWNSRAEWTPDSRRVVFWARRGDGPGLWWQPADRSGSAELLVAASDVAGNPLAGVVSPDGRTLLFCTIATRGATKRDLLLISLAGDRTPRRFSEGPADECMPRFSPDGRWIAYTSDESAGRYEIYVRPFPGPGGPVKVSEGGGGEPLWSPDGRRIFYRNGRQMLAASVSTAPAFAVTARDTLFEGDYMGGAPHTSYDIAPDGKHFLMLEQAGDESPQIVVVLNWLTELRARLEASKR